MSLLVKNPLYDVPYNSPERSSRNKQIKFSHNWNKKLTKNIFTTIRKSSTNKYIYYQGAVGELFDVMLEDSKVCQARLKNVYQKRYLEIDELILRQDTGIYSLYDIHKIFRTFGITAKDDVLILLFARED